MNGDPTSPGDEPAPAIPPGIDPDSLKDAHGRTGRMFQTAGLPFEEDEFDDEDSTSASSTGEAPPAAD